MAPFWRNGAKTPGVDEWVKVLGTDPVLILLDEMPSYVNLTAEDADAIYMSESGPPDPAQSARLYGRVYETGAPAVWFLGGYTIALAASPRAAAIRVTFDGADPRTGPEIAGGEIDAPAGAVKLRTVAELGARPGNT